jgi:hypothetical protein
VKEGEERMGEKEGRGVKEGEERRGDMKGRRD